MITKIFIEDNNQLRQAHNYVHVYMLAYIYNINNIYIKKKIGGPLKLRNLCGGTT